jgi:hypothetical protein
VPEEFVRAIALVVVLAGTARADLAPPPAPKKLVPDDELKTHGPPPERARPSQLAPATTQAPPPGPPPTPQRDATRPVERESAGPEQPLDFVDATLETPDLSARFTSTRPAWKRVVPPPRRPRGGAR